MKKEILIVDDDKEIRTSIIYSLKKESEEFIIHEAENGREGLKIINNNLNINVMILDIIMPDINGTKVLFELQKRRRKPTHIIVLSAFPEQLSYLEALKYKVYQFLNKPVKLDPLLFAIKSAFIDLRNKELEDAVKSIKNIYTPVLRDNLKLDNIFDLILKESIRLTASKNGSILTLDPLNNDLIIRDSWGATSKLKRYIGKRVPIDNSISGKAYKSQSTFVAHNRKEIGLYYDINKDMKSDVAVPLIAEGKCIGILNIGSYSENHFYDANIELLNLLAFEASILIQSVYLKDELLKKESFAKLSDVSIQLTHSIGSVIAKIFIQAQLLQDELKRRRIDLDGKISEYISDILVQCNIATETKKRILISYMNDKLEEVDLNYVVQAALEEKKKEILDKNMNTSLELYKDPIIIVANFELIKIALLELINNAINSMTKKGVLTITTSISKNKESYFLNIKDTGKGIHQEAYKKLFTPFFTTRQDEGGMGLGLWIVSEICNRFGANIRLGETNIGQGTIFIIEFPSK